MRKKLYFWFFGASLVMFCIQAHNSGIGSYVGVAFWVVFRLLAFGLFVKMSGKISSLFLKRYAWCREADTRNIRESLLWAYLYLEHACMGAVLPRLLRFPFFPPLRDHTVLFEFTLALCFLALVRCEILQKLERRNPLFGIPMISIIVGAFMIDQSFRFKTGIAASDSVILFLAFTYVEMIASSFLTLCRNRKR